jgi:peroxiredoxin
MRSLFILLLLIFTLGGVASGQRSLSAGTTAPVFAVTGLDGQTYDLSQFRGKVVLVTFWSTKCNICHAEIPKLNRLAERYDGQDVVFLGLTMENETKVSMYLKNSPFAFTILPNSFGVVLQYADRDRSGNINMGFPAYFLIDRNGNIRSRTSGWDKTPNLDSQISGLLAAANDATTAGSAQK